MIDMKQTIVPKSDQLNADDLIICKSFTIKITSVKVISNQQPVSIGYEGDRGKPYKPCKSMCRVLIMVWGDDGEKYIGQSMTLYLDKTVKWGGSEVGGIRISHMTGLAEKKVMQLTATKGNRKPFSVEPLIINQAATDTSEVQKMPEYITNEQVDILRGKITDAGLSEAEFCEKINIKKIFDVPANRLDAAHIGLDTKIKEKAA